MKYIYAREDLRSAGLWLEGAWVIALVGRDDKKAEDGFREGNWSCEENYIPVDSAKKLNIIYHM